MPAHSINTHNRKKIVSIITIAFAIVCFTRCQGLSGKSFVPDVPGYNVNQRQVRLLDNSLLEISGIFYETHDRMAAINDEDGKIFLLNTNSGAIEKFKYDKKRDYEDIVRVGDFYYVLESNGNLHQVDVNKQEGVNEFVFHVHGKVEFESLYYEKSTQKLVLITKDHRIERNVILAYSFDLATQSFSNEPYFSISMHEVKAGMKNDASECKPSAAAIHPILNKLFVIASVGKVLLQCNITGKVERTYGLNPDHFPQPEGITFAPNGDMYISNEGAQGKATLIVFPYNK